MTRLIDFFGGCPECGLNDGCLNIGGSLWFFCSTHRTKWDMGPGDLFEDEEEWDRNAATLASYREVEPVEDPVWRGGDCNGCLSSDEVARGQAELAKRFPGLVVVCNLERALHKRRALQ